MVTRAHWGDHLVQKGRSLRRQGGSLGGKGGHPPGGDLCQSARVGHLSISRWLVKGRRVRAVRWTIVGVLYSFQLIVGVIFDVGYIWSWPFRCRELVLIPFRSTSKCLTWKETPFGDLTDLIIIGRRLKGPLGTDFHLSVVNRWTWMWSKHWFVTHRLWSETGMWSVGIFISPVVVS